MRDIKAIRNDEDLAWALAEVEAYFDEEPEIGSEDGERFQVLSDLIEAYENKFHPIDAPDDPIDFLRAFMELTGRTQADLGHLLGSRSRASEILKRKRALTIDMIEKLSSGWKVPAECLVRTYDLAAA